MNGSGRREKFGAGVDVDHYGCSCPFVCPPLKEMTGLEPWCA